MGKRARLRAAARAKERRTKMGDNHRDREVQEIKFPPPPIGLAECGDCWVWVEAKSVDPNAEEDTGYCRNDPPKPFIVKSQIIVAGSHTPQCVALYPPVHRHNWCGKSVPKFAGKTEEAPEPERGHPEKGVPNE